MKFLDTNILLYAGSNAPADSDKKRIAAELITTEDVAISAQVIQEFVANALKKPQLGYDPIKIRTVLERFELIPVQPITLKLIRAAFELQQRYRISQWDATIVAAAHELGCQTLYSEDLNHGQSYGGVRVCNPFIRK